MAAVAGVGLVAAGLLTASPASADPSGADVFQTRPLQGVGSDTTQNVMSDIGGLVVDGSGNKQIASWDATGTGSFTTRTTGCSYTRTEANGSGAGRSRLLESLNGTAATNPRFGCLDFSRSSSGKGTLVTTPSLTWIPFANDDATYVVRSDGTVSRNLTIAQLTSAYKCQLSPDIIPVLPQVGSGTRSFWLGIVGITEADITANLYPCLTGAGTTASRAYVQENDSRTLKADEVMPFSVGLYNTQVSGVNIDNRGVAVLGQIGGILPTGLATSFPVRRSLYNVIPTAKVGVAPWSTVFVGATSSVCSQAATVTNNGFAPLSATSTPVCGDTSSAS
jgi:ABC-type phosphate transport system substrate-binding protein